MNTELDGVVEVTIGQIADQRGWFARAWCVDEFGEAGLDFQWVQVNQGQSPQSRTLRGMHLQLPPHGEVKYVRCISGRVFDVAVDVRSHAATYRRWVGRELSAAEGNGLIIPAGFAHGYMTLEPESAILYWTDSHYHPDSVTGVRFDDPELSITWPSAPTRISEQDLNWPLLKDRDDL